MQKRMQFALVGFCLLVLCGAPWAQAQEPPEPNQATHIQFTGSYTYDGGQVAVAGISIPVTSRFSLLAVNAVAPQVKTKDGTSGVTFHTLELEYARNLADFLKRGPALRRGSAQVNPSRFFVAVSGGAGTVRNAQGQGNASFAFSVAGRFTLRVNENTSLDLVNVRYWRSRIATVAGQQGGDVQAGAQFRITF